MKKTEEQKFLEVKEQLDYYRLPTIFPIEATDLLSRLIELIGKQDRKGKQNVSTNLNGQEGNELSSAVRHEIGKVTKQNNRLHLELMSAKEQIQSLKYSIQKHAIQKGNGNQEMALLLATKQRREDELFDELTQVKYKYNQLMDLIHEDSAVEKKYIKRLMKHRRLEVEQKQSSQEPVSKKSQSKTNTELESRLILISNKLSNREAEIVRLQKKLEFDGLNMNKILKNFQNDRIDSKINTLEDQVNYLEEENKKLKAEVDSVRKKGGSKEALREEMRKNHETIANLSAENKQLKRKVKQKQFDVNFKHKEGNRAVEKAQAVAEQLSSNNQLATLTIENLNKRIQFLDQQLASAKRELHRQQTSNMNKQIVIDQLKNTQEGSKILSHYQVENMKQQLEENNFMLREYQQKISKATSENKYLQEEGVLKSEAIENLEKIVDELMRRNSYHKTNMDMMIHESEAVNIENTIILRKSLGEAKQLLAAAQNDKQRLEKELQNLMIRIDHKSKENLLLSDEINRLKIRLAEIKGDSEEFNNLKRLVDGLQNDLRREQSLRNKIEIMCEESDKEKAKLRRQLQELTQQFEIYEKKAKNHLNSQKLEMTELEENFHLQEIRAKDKDKKIALYEEKLEELTGKLKVLRDEVTLIEDEKHNAIRDKHRVEKRYEELLKKDEELRGKGIHIEEITQNEHAADLIRYKKELAKLEERIEYQNAHINELTRLCQALSKQKELIASEKSLLIRENDALKMRINELERLLIVQDKGKYQQR